MTFTNKNNWREDYFQCRAAFIVSKESSWKHSAENQRSMLCAGVAWKSNSVQNVRTHCMAPALTWGQSGVSCRPRDLGHSWARCFPSPTACSVPRVWSPALYVSAFSAAAAAVPITGAHFREMRNERFPEKWAPCFWWWQLQQPNMRIFWIILIDSLVGWTNLFCKCSH